MSQGTQGAGTIIRNTYYAVVMNVSNKKYLFVNARTRAGDEYSKTYRLERGKRHCIAPEDFIVMRPELTKLVAQNKLNIIRDIQEETRSMVTRPPAVSKNTPAPLMRGCPIGEDGENHTLKHFFARKEDPGPEERDDNTYWFVDRGTGNFPQVDIDFRFQIAGQIYSVFDNFAVTSIGVTVPITVGDWVASVEDGEDWWYQDLHHSMSSARIQAEIWKEDRKVTVDLKNEDPFYSRIWVPGYPDLRFEGYGTFVKINPF